MKEKEVINDLLSYNNLKIVQNKDYFNFSLDSVLLPNFIKVNKNTKKILDLCTGNAPIPLILSTKTNAKIYGIELQKEIYDLAVKSVRINNLEEQITIINEDIKNIYTMFESDTFDIITCNPPYFKCLDTSLLNTNDIKSIARHEIKLNLEDIFSLAKKLLKNNAELALVHRTDRLVDIICLMKKYNIEPKTIRFIYPKEKVESNIMLISGKKNGNPGIKLLSPLIVHNSDGSYKEEILDMFK